MIQPRLTRTLQVYCAAVVDPSQTHAASIVLKLLHELLAVAFPGSSANRSAVLSELPSNRSAFCAFQAGSGPRAEGWKGGGEEGDGAAVGLHQQQRGRQVSTSLESTAGALVPVGSLSATATAASVPTAAHVGDGASAVTGAIVSNVSDVGAESEGRAALGLGGAGGGTAVPGQTAGRAGCMGGDNSSSGSGSSVVRRNSWQRIESVALLPGLLGAMVQGNGERWCIRVTKGVPPLIRTKKCLIRCVGFCATVQHEPIATRQPRDGRCIA